MKILVTGGAGYLGSVLVGELLKRGDEVTVLDSFIFDQNSLDEYKSNPSFHLYVGDIRETELLKSLMIAQEVIIPLAALVGAPLCDKDPDLTKEVNLESVKTMIKFLSPDQKIIYPTTNSGYGVGEKGKFCDENSTLRPVSLYGKTKVEAEKALLESGQAVTFRLATVFGVSPRMRLDLLVNDFVYKALTDGKIELFEGHFNRNYIHIHDVARAFIHGIENFDSMKGEAYNVGLSSANLSKLELCQKIKSHIPDFQIIESKTGKDPDQRDYLVSNEKIEGTGYTPVFSLDDGIKELMVAFPSFNSEMKNI